MKARKRAQDAERREAIRRSFYEHLRHDPARRAAWETLYGCPPEALLCDERETGTLFINPADLDFPPGASASVAEQMAHYDDSITPATPPTPPNAPPGSC